ncbi:substrate-binding periplasmic protein, partial [Undibacterium luofuense]
INFYPFNRIFSNLKKGEGLVFDISKTAERESYLYFSKPVYANYVWLVMRSDARFNFNDLQDLKGKTIGVVAGATYGDEFEQAKISRLFKIENDPPILLKRCEKLYLRSMDAMFHSSGTAKAKEVERLLN